MLIVDAARAVLIARSNDPEVRREVAALLGSLDGTLSDEQVLEIKSVESRRFAFSTIALRPAQSISSRIKATNITPNRDLERYYNRQ
jgi:hypothetical protein